MPGRQATPHITGVARRAHLNGHLAGHAASRLEHSGCPLRSASSRSRQYAASAALPAWIWAGVWLAMRFCKTSMRLLIGDVLNQSREGEAWVDIGPARSFVLRRYGVDYSCSDSRSSVNRARTAVMSLVSSPAATAVLMALQIAFVKALCASTMALILLAFTGRLSRGGLSLPTIVRARLSLVNGCVTENSVTR